VITLLKERGGLKQRRLFQEAGREAVITEIVNAVNENINVISRADVPTLAELLKVWLRELPDRLLPIQMREMFLEMAGSSKFLGFVEKMPQTHQLTFLYVIGFFQDVSKSGEHNGCNQCMIAAQFGSLVVNTERRQPEDAQNIERLNISATAFVGILIEAKETAIISPIAERYLVKGEGKATGKVGRLAGFAQMIDLDYGGVKDK
jgi:hypothetical protein